jgi:hypothetical protein
MKGESGFKEAVSAIKGAIVSLRYWEAAQVNKKLLSLYFGVGKHVRRTHGEDFGDKEL